MYSKLLNSLHWLPVRYRISFKICTTAYLALSCNQPSCLHSLLTPVRKPVQLRPSSSGLFLVPKVNTSIDTRVLLWVCIVTAYSLECASFYQSIS